MVDLIINGCNGTMGKALASAAISTDGFNVVAGVDPFGEALPEWDFKVYRTFAEVKEKGDVVVDFSRADSLPDLVAATAAVKIPLVVATTGLTGEHLKMLEESSGSRPVLQAANLSLGINLLKVLIKQTAAVLNTTFDIEIIEKHHNLKRDAPSGTALALADTLKDAISAPVEFVYGRHESNKLRSANEIGIHAVRGGSIIGDHDVIFAGKDERLTLSHSAYSKALFAVGALQAVEYISKRNSGFYRMDDVIAEKSTVTHLYIADEALVNFRRIPDSFGTAHKIFETFSDAGINIDMISQTVSDEGFHSLAFTIDNKNKIEVSALLDKLHSENSQMKGMLIPDLVKITVEGIGMESQLGVASAVFRILDDLKVEAKSVTTSETKIAFIIDREHKDSVIERVSLEYGLS